MPALSEGSHRLGPQALLDEGDKESAIAIHDGLWDSHNTCATRWSGKKVYLCTAAWCEEGKWDKDEL